MRAVVRTGRSTGVSVGPLGLVFLAIGYALYAALVAIVFVATMLVAAGVFVVGEVRRRRAASRVATRRG